MCKPAKNKKPTSPRSQRVQVGRCMGDWVLLSEGEDPNGLYYTIWIGLENWKQSDNGRSNNMIATIELGTKNNDKWTYQRKYECYNLNNAIGKFLELVNPSLNS
ncbi:hypothetical protein ACFLT3_01140 [Chloroflexota bacterium]